MFDRFKNFLGRNPEQFNKNGDVFIKFTDTTKLNNLRESINSYAEHLSELEFLTVCLDRFAIRDFIFKNDSKELNLLKSTVNLLVQYNEWNKQQNISSGGKKTRRNPSGNNKKTYKNKKI